MAAEVVVVVEEVVVKNATTVVNVDTLRVSAQRVTDVLVVVAAAVDAEGVVMTENATRKLQHNNIKTPRLTIVNENYV